MMPSTVCLLVALPLSIQPEHEPPKSTQTRYPNPLITEVLFDVPRGTQGDADQSGSRSAQGDEFIEVVNPHDKPINLKGYVLADSDRPRSPRPRDNAQNGKNDKDNKSDAGKVAPENDASKPGQESRVRFVFPDCELAPGEVAVVFNGFESAPPGPVGDEQAAKAPNPKFSGARVFTMRNTSRYAAFSNTSDCVRLISPSGETVHCVSWGEAPKDACSGASLTESVSPVRVSIQRRSVNDGFVPHDELDSRSFSPGEFAATPVTVKRDKPAAAPAPGKK